MSGPIAPDLAREQLSELISILGELRNAGPRDQRFKQWRQITTTLLQRIWPGDPARAERFRRIPFSAPTAFSDRRATRVHFERGCREAGSYLNELAVELGAVAMATPPPIDPPDTGDAPAADEIEVLDLPAAAWVEPSEPLEGPTPHETPAAAKEPPARAAPSPPPEVWREEPPDSPAAPRVPTTTDSRQEVRESTAGPKPRLKDMLGFTEQSAPDPPRPRTVPGAPPPAPVRFVPLTPEPVRGDAVPPARLVPPPKPDPRVPVEPSAAVTPHAAPIEPPVAVTPPAALPPAAPVEPRAPVAAPLAQVERPAVVAPPPTPVPPPAPRAVMPEDERRDRWAELTRGVPGLDLEAKSNATKPPTKPTPDSTAASELLALAGQVEELGVPPRERGIVRAALIDLGRQMESPPINWEALRETVAFAMDYPALARRVLPLVLPYLDHAA